MGVGMRKGRTAIDVQTVVRFLLRGTRRAALTVVGFALVCLGLAGLVLPVLPGWILIIGGFAVLSREYSWAHSGLTIARRHAARSGTKVRSMVARRRRAVHTVDLADTPERPGGDHSTDVVIDLRNAQEQAADSASTGPKRS